ncbi:MAG: hypothetical protein WCJ51_03925 [Candidatus Moraniibacteriota bacterium]
MSVDKSRQEVWAKLINLMVAEHRDAFRSGDILVKVILVKNGIREEVWGALNDHSDTALILDTSDESSSTELTYVLLNDDILVISNTFTGDDISFGCSDELEDD